MTPTERKHGGARPGAGRKPLGPQKRVMVALRLPPDVASWLRSQPESQADIVSRLVREEAGL